jgi:sugar phosphate isomerase/epimerase
MWFAASLGALAYGPILADGRNPSPFIARNLTAWCIVPFDAKNRTPEERAQMLSKLNIRQFAYDWRDEHLPLLDRELDALRKNGIRLTAFWFPSSLEPQNDPNVRRILEFLKRRNVKTQLWLSLNIPEQDTTHAQRIESAAKAVQWIADEANRIGCKVALYNHGGWYGEPDNQIQIIRASGRKNVGIVYNFHHGHHHIDRFPELFTRMKPYLLALNINGMRPEGPKILNVGDGIREEAMLRVVRDSGWSGPVGILGHRAELDAEEALRGNLKGLASITDKWRAESKLEQR